MQLPFVTAFFQNDKVSQTEPMCREQLDYTIKNFRENTFKILADTAIRVHLVVAKLTGLLVLRTKYHRYL